MMETTDVARSQALATICAMALDLTASSHGWLLAVDHQLTVAIDPHGVHQGTSRKPEGAAGLCARSGQAAAIITRPGDDQNLGAAGSDGLPGAILVAPCGVDRVAAVLEVARDEPMQYSLDDVELLTVFGDIAGSVIADLEQRVGVHDGPAPGEVIRKLEVLSSAEPTRYAGVVQALNWMLL